MSEAAQGVAWSAARCHGENIWLRTKRYDANGKVRGGTGGVCYIFWPTKSAPSQHRALRALGLV